MLDITMIGCGATRPLPTRATASCAIQYKGRTVLLDCGEGTQVAAARAGVSLVKINAICLTHYHGDHILGLPGLLQTMGSLGRTEPVLLTGPAEGYDHTIPLLLALAEPLPFEIIRRPICMDGDEQELWSGLRLKCTPLFHRAPCVGYRIELPRSGRFLPERAAALGVPSEGWNALQRGESTRAADGSLVEPGQVLGPPRHGLAVVYATDTAPCSNLPDFARGADLLLCDATYAGDEYLERAQMYGHSTFTQCGKLAVQAGVQRLWLTHYGGGLTDPEACIGLAQEHFPAAEAGYDGKHIRLNFQRDE